MAKTVILHILNEDPIVADMEDLPDPGSSYITCTNLRKRDGKPVTYLTPGARTILYPWNRINFIEIMVSDEEKREVVDWFRE
ncbi:MAG TPA: hypothetical protein VH186_31085 [Chloroflexia bacterium]|nr:hypothetical protein [Chloroflexia bacterium]